MAQHYHGIKHPQAYCALPDEYCRGFNPLPANLYILNVHSLGVVSRWRDPQLRVGENCSYLFILRTSIYTIVV